MSDACFICLQNTKNNVCSQCNIKAHNKCFSQFLQHKYHISSLFHLNKEYSSKKIECPQCKVILNKQGVVTRSFNKKLVTIQKIKNLLEDVEKAIGKNNKKISSEQLFEFLLANIWFMNRHKKFRKQVKLKLKEFHRQESDWDFPAKIYKKMFNKNIDR
jgi:DNA helicase IV